MENKKRGSEPRDNQQIGCSQQIAERIDKMLDEEGLSVEEAILRLVEIFCGHYSSDHMNLKISACKTEKGYLRLDGIFRGESFEKVHMHPNRVLDLIQKHGLQLHMQVASYN